MTPRMRLNRCLFSSFYRGALILQAPVVFVVELRSFKRAGGVLHAPDGPLCDPPSARKVSDRAQGSIPGAWAVNTVYKDTCAVCFDCVCRVRWIPRSASFLLHERSTNSSGIRVIMLRHWHMSWLRRRKKLRQKRYLLNLIEIIINKICKLQVFVY